MKESAFLVTQLLELHEKNPRKGEATIIVKVKALKGVLSTEIGVIHKRPLKRLFFGME
jgi:hypothetical protein